MKIKLDFVISQLVLFSFAREYVWDAVMNSNGSTRERDTHYALGVWGQRGGGAWRFHAGGLML